VFLTSDQTGNCCNPSLQWKILFCSIIGLLDEVM